ncbi:uncharacterized protein YALI1_A11833g [Yarrowia lipolytica]|uniref:Uncharacterized protein n=1 Tax=Yarrowia lipolytica TaxID=4952 RepID=A0A1D8N4G6_YARLL|nr:hypothetical protein YALI1_A11833g [Yarrowia lipolytica]
MCRSLLFINRLSSPYIGTVCPSPFLLNDITTTNLSSSCHEEVYIWRCSSVVDGCWLFQRSCHYIGQYAHSGIANNRAALIGIKFGTQRG